MVFQVLLNMTSQWKYIHDCDDGDDDDDDDDDDGMSTVQCSPQDLLNLTCKSMPLYVRQYGAIVACKIYVHN